MSLAPIEKNRPGILSHAVSLGKKEALHILRSPWELLLILTMPGVLTFLFGYAFEVGEVRGIRTLVVDEDQSMLSRRIVDKIARDLAFRVTTGTLAREEAARAMDLDRYLAIVRIPAGTERTARSKGSATLWVDLSGIDVVSAPTAMRALTQIVFDENAKLLVRRLSVLGMDAPELSRTLRPLDPKFQILYNPNLRFINYVMPGIIGLILQLLTVGLMAGSLTREKELGTFEAILASPASPVSLLLGKALPYFAVSLLEVATILIIARAGFGVSLGPGAAPALFLTVLFVLASLATGLLISSITRTQAQSLEITVFYSLPVFMLSGAYAPLNIVPEDVRHISWVFPLAYFCRAFRSVSMKRLSLADVWLDVLLLLGYSLLAAILARVFLRKRLD